MHVPKTCCYLWSAVFTDGFGQEIARTVSLVENIYFFRGKHLKVIFPVYLICCATYTAVQFYFSKWWHSTFNLGWDRERHAFLSHWNCLLAKKMFGVWGNGSSCFCILFVNQFLALFINRNLGIFKLNMAVRETRLYVYLGFPCASFKKPSKYT